MSFAARTDKSEMRAVEKDLIHGWSMLDRCSSAGRCTFWIALSGHPSPDTAKVPAVSVFLGLWRQSCRAAPRRTGRVIGIAAANLTARSGDVQRKLSSSSLSPHLVRLRTMFKCYPRATLV